MQDYRVELDAYSGPLDLLLYLVKRDEINLRDIPIARLAEQYLEYLKLLQQIDVNLAGEFLVMAATLLEIKSALLVPRPETPPGGEGEPSASVRPAEQLDPRYELVQQLLAYKRFKEAAMELEDRRQDWEARFARVPACDPAQRPALGQAEGDEGDEASAALLEIDLEDVHVLDLCEAFSRILETIGRSAAHHEVVYDDTPIGLHADDILDRLAREGPMTLQEMFVARSRSEAIGLFLAMLELVRQRRLKVTQDRVAGEIRLELRHADPNAPAVAEAAPPPPPVAATPAALAHAGTAAPAAPGGQPVSREDPYARWRDPVTGDVQWEWPSEEARQRAERRAKLRAARAAAAAKGQFAQPVGDEVIDVDGIDMAEHDDDNSTDLDGPATGGPEAPLPGPPADAPPSA